MTPSERRDYAQVVADSVVRDALNANPQFEQSLADVVAHIKGQTDDDLHKGLVQMRCRWLLEDLVGRFDSND